MFETAETAELLDALLDRLAEAVPGAAVTLYHDPDRLLTAKFEAAIGEESPFPVLSLSSAGDVCMALDAAIEDDVFWDFPQIFVELTPDGRRVRVGVSYQEDLDEGCASLRALAEHLIPVLEGCALCPDAGPVATDCPPLPPPGFPRFWHLFRLLLPRSVRERIYDPCHEELKEEYLLERGRWTGRIARRWVTFCFTARTIGLVGESLWTAGCGAVGRFTLAALTAGAGIVTIAALHERIAQWFGRLW